MFLKGFYIQKHEFFFFFWLLFAFFCIWSINRKCRQNVFATLCKCVKIIFKNQNILFVLYNIQLYVLYEIKNK